MKKIISTYILVLIVSVSFGQLNPFGGFYYQNQYLANPALVGEVMDWEINANYKAQWTAVEGSPSMQALTLTHGFANKKVGLGFNVYNETAGVFKRTSAKFTYAYHLIVNDDQTTFLDFGISGGLMNERIDFDKVKGDATDISLINFNERETYIDGDLGFAFRSSTINIQASLPNLKRLFNRDVYRRIVDKSTYMAGISYKFMDASGTTRIEPKFVYRGVQNYKDIIDAGVSIGLNEEKLNFSGIYHSTNSVTFGAGTVFQKYLGIFAYYTTNTSDLQGYSNGEFEIGLKYNWR